MARPFTSFDGYDPQGIRAEVVVEVHTGTVKEISELEKVAKVTFLGDGLNNPVHGYINLEDPLFEVIKAAKKSKETVEYRIEIVRKKHVARDIPMSQLRETMETARDNVVKIVAGINVTKNDDGTISGLAAEHHTDPTKDPAAGGVYRATDHQNEPAAGESTGGNSGSSASSALSPEASLEILANAVKAGVPHEALSVLLASAIRDGAEPTHALAVAYPSENAPKVQHVRSREEAVFRKFNSDGTLNLGSSQVISGVSSENFARRILTPVAETLSEEDFTALVEKYASIILAIADNIQVSAYGNSGQADRMAGSHTRIRGVVYDVIENHFQPPALNKKYTSEDEFNWLAKVGKVAKERFFSAIRISESAFVFASLKAPAQTVVPAEQMGTSATEDANKEAPVVEAPVAEAPVAEAPVEEAPVAEAPVADEAPEQEEEDFELFDFTVTDPSDPAPTVKDINKLKALLKEFAVDEKDINKVGSLLEFSFGTRLAKEVPAVNLAEFIEFYKENGKENLHAAIRNVDTLLADA
jgi:hypothetical protein